MSPSSISQWLTYGLGPSIPAIIIGIIITLSFPVLLHMFLYRKRASHTLPTFLLTGPSGSGKTSLLTLLERGTPSATHTSQAPLRVECEIPVTVTAASNRYRSVNDPSSQTYKKFFLVDTPGHGKLRQFAITNLLKPQNLRGILFVIDATTLSSEVGEGLPDAGGLGEASSYLHDLLLTLQKRSSSSKSSRDPGEMHVLIAANKLDLFTALPPKLVQSALEAEITKIRDVSSKGLLDSGIGMDETFEDDKEALGGAGEGRFSFALMEEYNIFVQVLGGNVLGTDGADVQAWWSWIAEKL